MRERIRVGHILPWPGVGGSEVATARMAKLVGGDAFEHIAYCLPGDHACRRMFEAEGFETREFVAVEPSWRRPGPWWKVSWALAQDMRRRGITLMHCADVLAAHYAAWAGRLAGIPVLSHVRNRFARISRGDRTLRAPVGRVAWGARDTGRRCAHRGPERRGRVIYDGIDVPMELGGDTAGVREEFSVPAEARLVGMVARIAPQKDQATLIRAAARLKAAGPELRFLLIGDYEDSRERADYYLGLRKQLEEAGLQDRFVFTGHREDVRRLMGALDIFALATHLEGLPLVILEAMALGKPVIATGLDGVPEVVEDGVTGLLHRHEDDEQLAEQIARLAGDRALAERMGAAGRRRVKKSFSTEQFAEAMRTLYEELAGTGRS